MIIKETTKKHHIIFIILLLMCNDCIQITVRIQVPQRYFPATFNSQSLSTISKDTCSIIQPHSTCLLPGYDENIQITISIQISQIQAHTVL